jgi:hypothetical protein
MKPREKAEDLLYKMMYHIKYNCQPTLSEMVAKQCALIAVDEIEEALTDYGRGDSLQLQNMDSEFRYWSKVREEIPNIKTN